MLHAGFDAGLQSDSDTYLMVRRRSCAVSNHGRTLRLASFETREDALLRMRLALVERVLNDV
jgi:hypothetical protein